MAAAAVSFDLEPPAPEAVEEAAAAKAIIDVAAGVRKKRLEFFINDIEVTLLIGCTTTNRVETMGMANEDLIVLVVRCAS